MTRDRGEEEEEAEGGGRKEGREIRKVRAPDAPVATTNAAVFLFHVAHLTS